MSDQARLTIVAGDIEIDLSGSTQEIDEERMGLEADMTWSVLVERIKSARENAIEAAKAAAEEAGLPEHGSAFRTLIDTCKLIKKPDQVLGSIHYLRDVEGLDDAPPRVINQLFEDSQLDPPGNLSLYLNRLRERGLLVIPEGGQGKNRYAVLTEEGRAHLDQRAKR